MFAAPEACPAFLGQLQDDHVSNRIRRPRAGGTLASGRRFNRVRRLAYLAPDIIEGRQPPELTTNKLVRVKNLPID